MPRDTLAPYSWPCSPSWCLAEGYRNGDQRRLMGPCGSGRTLLLRSCTTVGQVDDASLCCCCVVFSTVKSHHFLSVGSTCGCCSSGEQCSWLWLAWRLRLLWISVYSWPVDTMHSLWSVFLELVWSIQVAICYARCRIYTVSQKLIHFLKLQYQ